MHGVRALLSKRGQWRVRTWWVVVAVVLGLVLRVIMSVIALLLGLIPAIELRPWTPAQLALFAVMLFIFAIPEELGWRGYVFPKLLTRPLARRHLRKASARYLGAPLEPAYREAGLAELQRLLSLH